MKSLWPVLPVIRNHHERWDGSGYPDGLEKDRIPLLAGVLQVADIYDALRSARSYKSAFSHEEALAVLQEEVRRGWRNPQLVEAFIAMLDVALLDRSDDIQLSLENLSFALAR